MTASGQQESWSQNKCFSRVGSRWSSPQHCGGVCIWSWNWGRLKMISLYEKIKYFFSKSTQVQIIICTCVLFEKKICHQLHHCRVLVKHPIASAWTHHYTSTILLPSCSWTSSSPHTLFILFFFLFANCGGKLPHTFSRTLQAQRFWSIRTH